MNRGALAKLHIAKKQLGMDEETYRAMLLQHGGVRSAKDLSERGLARVMAHLRSCGAEFSAPRRNIGKRPHNFNRLPAYVDKVEAQLADMGLSWAYADSIARNITGGHGAPEQGKDPGVERLAWVTQDKHWRAIIAALDVEQEKRQRLASIDALLAELGLGRDYVESIVDGHPRAHTWTRYRPLLSAILKHLEQKTGKACN